MQLDADLDALARAVRTVRPALRDAADGRNVVALRASDRNLELSATGRSMTITRVVPATVRKGGTAVVPARILADLLAQGSSPSVTLQADPENLQVELGELGATLRLIHDSPPEPLRVAEGETQTSRLSADEAERAGALAIVASPDAQRPVLTGVHLGPDHAEATDSYRAARTTLEAWHLDLVVPADLVRLVAAERSEVWASFDGRVVSFRTTDTSWTTAVIATAYPPITHFATVTLETMTCERLALLTAVESAAVIPGALIELNAAGGRVTVSSESLELGRVASVVQQVGTTDVEALFTAKYLLDALKLATSDTVSFRFAERHVLIGCDAYLQLIMKRAALPPPSA
jgi:DNA polymerase III sliding clamp (beta) subunit (PCNA family)